MATKIRRLISSPLKIKKLKTFLNKFRTAYYIQVNPLQRNTNNT